MKFFNMCFKKPKPSRDEEQIQHKDPKFGNVDITARNIAREKRDLFDRVYYNHLKPAYVPPLVTGNEIINKTNMPSFDEDKLNIKISELRNINDGDPYPDLHVHTGENVEDFKMAKFIQCSNNKFHDPSTLQGWLKHDTNEEFKNSCNAIANIYGAKPELVEAAIWLLNVHYMDGEGDNMTSYYSFDEAKNLYGLRDKTTFQFMCDVYGDFYHCDIARLAQLLEN